MKDLAQLCLVYYCTLSRSVVQNTVGAMEKSLVLTDDFPCGQSLQDQYWC